MKVIATIQSTYTADGYRPNSKRGRINEPVDMPYYTGSDLAAAIVAMGQAALTWDTDHMVDLLAVRLEL